MSCKLQIVNAALAITAFTLAIACPPTCIKPVYTKDNQDIFEFYEQFSEKQIISFFEQKKMNEVLISYKTYKSSDCEQIKQAYITSLYQYYSKHKCVDQDVHEINEYVENQSDNSECQNEYCKEVKTKEGQDIFEFFEQFSEDEVTSFFTQKGMQKVLQLYKSYKLSKCQQIKLEYIKSLYIYYSKQKCVDQDVQELKEFIKNKNQNIEIQIEVSSQNDTNETNQKDNTNSSQDISDVRSNDGQDIFEFYEQFSKEQVISFFEQKGMNEVIQAYKSYKSSESQQDKLTYTSYLSRYYSKNGYADQHVQEFSEYVNNQKADSKSQSQDSSQNDTNETDQKDNTNSSQDISDARTNDGQSIFEFYEQFSKEQVISFFEQKGMNEVIQAYKSYKSSESQQDKLTYTSYLSRYYSKNGYADQHVQEFNEYINNQKADSKSQSQDNSQNDTNETNQKDNTNSSQDISDARTNDGQSIFEFYEQFSKEQVISFFEQKGMNEVIQAYKSYKSSESQQDKLTYTSYLSRYYSKNGYADQHVQEFSEYVNNQKADSKSQSQDSSQNDTNETDQKDNTNSSQDISVVRTNDGQSIFEFYEQFSKEQVISFFEQKGMNEVIQAYKSYKSSESQQDKLTYTSYLSRYYSKNGYADQHVQEFSEYVNNQKADSKSQSQDSSQNDTNETDQKDNTNSSQDISDARTNDGQSIFEFYEQFSKEQVISFFEQKGMNEVIQAYKSYKSSESQQDKLTYTSYLFRYYSKNGYADQHVQEFSEYVNNQKADSKSQSQDSSQNDTNETDQKDNTNSSQDISVVRTNDGQDIFEFFEQHPEEQVISFFEKNYMREIVQAYKSYKSSTCQSTRQAYIKSLYQYYSKHGCALQHIHEMNECLKNEKSNYGSNGNQLFATKEIKFVNSYTNIVSESI
ncbi:dentin sialophosphoprotein-like [Adelges cooleyi]|uniref:dentin sialophosphoprotein-like n=1 Tax=Adelges cooleyi TaxID=133065 RepID=UPI00218054B2|nr:dentin sialophosphoprotein-like [Adelges cooleyi]